ncbi:hypothetical protein PSHT_13619 [Puccinia striiformis]|uniref:Uncharacterized protein n=1 Tax=Puccinia striiformis TaxID=27350 RepID=A0A2S4UPQ8_9BASI|nr:hypothetical protein PSHT_13619 [Puccinia striiformis]
MLADDVRTTSVTESDSNPIEVGKKEMKQTERCHCTGQPTILVQVTSIMKMNDADAPSLHLIVYQNKKTTSNSITGHPESSRSSEKLPRTAIMNPITVTLYKIIVLLLITNLVGDATASTCQMSFKKPRCNKKINGIPDNSGMFDLIHNEFLSPWKLT